jgi:hypothetical protein
MNNKLSTKDIAKSGWIDDLSEEENKVLYKSHALDEKMREANPHVIKIGWLEDIKKHKQEC